MSTDGIRRWLSEFKTLTEVEWNTYAFGVRQDKELEQELQDALEGDLSAEAIDPICHQLFDFYRSMNVELQRFTLNLLPTLIGSYLTSLAKDKRFGSIEACLLAIYNLSVIGTDGKPKVSQVSIPTLACSSIYHEPPSLASLVLTESALLHHHSDRPTVVTMGPLAPVQCLNSQNRLPVLTYVINRYNANITCLSTSSHLMLCRLCSGLAKTGFDSLPEMKSSSKYVVERDCRIRRGVSFAEEIRVPLSSDFLLELLTSLYYIMFNSDAKCAINALEDIHTRASYDLLPDVLLVTNAIRNSIRVGDSDNLVDRTMGISVAVSPSQANPIFSKDAITNASFKARKLPEDIDVPEGSHPEEAIQSKDRGDVDTILANVAMSERPKITPQKATKGPMKSIMKKRDERLREKSSKGKDTEGARQSVPNSYEMHPTKSPRHSTPSTPNGEVGTHGVRVVFEQADGPTNTKSEAHMFLNLPSERPAIIVDDEDEDSTDAVIGLPNVVCATSNGGRMLVGESNMEI